MKILKAIRRWRYRWLLTQIETAERNYEEGWICLALAESFPFIPICCYPELINRAKRTSRGTVVHFGDNQARMKFVKEAIKLTYL